MIYIAGILAFGIVGAAVYMVGYIHGYVDGAQRLVAKKRAQ